jgi:hippurate hydrolase
LITTLQTLVSREIDPNQSAVLTIGKIQAGQVHNVIAGEAVLEGTIRSTHPNARQHMLSGLKRMVQSAVSLYDVEAELEFLESLPAVMNSKKASILARKAAKKIVAENDVISQGPSSLGGEDFAFYLQEISGCLVRFGARLSDGSGPAHSSTFDFDERVLPVGAAWYAQITKTFMQDYLSI